MEHRARVVLFAACVLLVIALGAVWIGKTVGTPATVGGASARAVTSVIHMLGPTHPPGIDPYIVTIHEGDRVIFENDVSPRGVHSVVAEDGSFTSPPLQPGQRWMTSFARQGSHIYHDPTAFAQVVGVIIVVPRSTVLQSPADPGSVATVVARAKAARSGGQSSSSSLISLLPWLLLVAGGGALVYVIYRRRRGAAKHG